MTAGSVIDDVDPVTPEPRQRRLGRGWSWVLRLVVGFLIVVVGVFVWGYFQPKPAGFAPTDPDAGAFVTDDWTRYTIDATSRDDWVFFDFGKGRSVEATLDSTNWDLAFKRTGLLTNSGLTNSTGHGGAMNLGEIPLENATAPASGIFVLDQLGGDDGDEVKNPEISRWYDYSFITHTVHAKDNTYLVRSGDDRDALVQFDSYYCDNQDAGCITFRYRLVPSVAGS
jgi:hypothetical protein